MCHFIQQISNFRRADDCDMNLLSNRLNMASMNSMGKFNHKLYLTSFLLTSDATITLSHILSLFFTKKNLDFRVSKISIQPLDGWMDRPTDKKTETTTHKESSCIKKAYLWKTMRALISMTSSFDIGSGNIFRYISQ